MANNGQQGWTVLEQYNVATGVATGVEKPNDIGDPDYVEPVTNTTACPLPIPPTPVTVHVNILRDETPYVDGSVGLRKNAGAEELFTFTGTSDSGLGFNVGDIMTVHSFHYHLGYRWPDDGSLTMNVRQGGIGGTIVYTHTGGTVGASDVHIHDITLTATEYTVQITTASSDTTLLTPGYDFINNTAIGDGIVKVSVIDTTTALTMLGEAPSQINVPATGVARTGSYNVKNDANPQTVIVENTSGISISVTVTTVPEGGSFTGTQSIAAGATYNFTGVDKVGFRLTVN